MECKQFSKFVLCYSITLSSFFYLRNDILLVLFLKGTYDGEERKNILRQEREMLR